MNKNIENLLVELTGMTVENYNELYHKCLSVDAIQTYRGPSLKCRICGNIFLRSLNRPEIEMSICLKCEHSNQGDAK